MKKMLALFFLLFPLITAPECSAESPPEGMVFVAGGIVRIGVKKKQLRYIVRDLNGYKRYHESARPSHKVDIKPFFIDEYEVTNGQYAKFLNAVGKEEEDGKLWINLKGVADENKEKCRIILKAASYEVEQGFDKHPVTFVSWFGANAYAKWADKRLPTEYEWEKAARGEEGFLFPWGDRYKKKYANCADGGPFKVLAVGTFNPKNKSPYGCYDMAGNVLEWTSSEYLPYPKSRFKDEFYSGGENGKRYVSRGGSWFVRDDECVSTKRFRYKPKSTFEDLGFRCVKDVK